MEAEISPEGTKIAKYEQGLSLERRDTQSGEVLASIPAQGYQITSLAWATTGRPQMIPSSNTGDYGVQMYYGSSGVPIQMELPTGSSMGILDERAAFSDNAEILRVSIHDDSQSWADGKIMGAVASRNSWERNDRYILSHFYAPDDAYIVASEATNPIGSWSDFASEQASISIWSRRDNAWLVSWEVPEHIFIEKIDVPRQLLITSHGFLRLRGPEHTSFDLIAPPQSHTEEHSISCHGIGLSLDGSWITINGELVLWLPAAYRSRHGNGWPGMSMVCGDGV